MNNKVGFDLKDAYFYIHGSNVSNVMRVGSSLSTSTVHLYADNDISNGFFVGVDAEPPRLWCREAHNNTPIMYVHDGNVGIGVSYPEYALHIDGDIGISGRVIQGYSNVSIPNITTLNSISAATPNGIDFTNTVIYNIASADINSGITVRGNPERHIMNGTQVIRAMKTTGIRSSVDEQVEYMTVSWGESQECFDPTFKIDVNFFGSGNVSKTRMHVKCECLVDVASGTLDAILDKSTFQSDNVMYIDIYANTVTTTSLQIGVKWRLMDNATHKGHLKVEVIAPFELDTLNVM